MNILFQNNIDLIRPLPRIVFVGDQSSGKSSLIEAISRIKVPRAVDTCTRCPMEVRLIQAIDDEPWSCKVSLHFADDFAMQGVPQREPETVHFDTTSIREDVEGIISRAQLAILNPSINYQEFRDMTAEDVDGHEGNELAFSKNSVIIEITGAKVDLTFIDLPGIIANTKTVTRHTERVNFSGRRQGLDPPRYQSGRREGVSRRMLDTSGDHCSR
jgi:GTPase SAR1 family protein